MITVFPKADEVDNPHYVEVDYMLSRIQSCVKQKEIDRIRNEQDLSKRRKLKKELPSIVFAGEFKTRNDSDIIQHSGFCILDFDHVENVENLKAEMSSFPFVYSAFVSPSGDGLKVLVRIPANPETHKGHYSALMKLFPTLDPTNKNLSRVCFESADPELYYNPEAIEFTDYAEEVKLQKKAPLVPMNFKFNDYSKANIALNMIRNAVDGTKHHVLLKASRLMGGFITGGYIDENEAYRLLEEQMALMDNGNFEGDKKTIRDGIEEGKLDPIIEVDKPQRKQSPTITPKTEGIQTVDSVWESMKYSFKHGKARGTTTHFPDFDENFTWKKGELTLIIGKGNSGKTEFILQLMLLKSVNEGWKWGIFSPENYPADEFYDTLIHAYIGKTTDPYWKQDQMTLQEYEKGYKFINEHFFYIYPEALHTIEEIESHFMSLIEEKKINGTLIDPFNQIISPTYERDDQFLSKFLTVRKTFAIKNDLCDVICTHPKNMYKNKDGEYDVPDAYDIAGGAMWINKIDNLLSVHRPNYVKSPQDSTVEIHVKKIKKQKLVGIPGMKTFDFSRRQNRYYLNGNSPLDKPITIASKSAIQPDPDAWTQSPGTQTDIDDMPF